MCFGTFVSSNDNIYLIFVAYLRLIIQNISSFVEVGMAHNSRKGPNIGAFLNLIFIVFHKVNIVSFGLVSYTVCYLEIVLVVY